MRGSFKQILINKKTNQKRSVEPFCRTQPYFLRLFGCLHYRALAFLSLTASHLHPHVSVRTFGRSPIFFFFCFEHMQPCYAELSLHLDHTFSFFGLHFLLSMSVRYLTLSLYLCIILVNGKQRCRCGSILSAQRVADGRKTCAVCNI